MRKIYLALILLCASSGAFSQTHPGRIYNEEINPETQIIQAVEKASKEGKFVVAQLGGNWCRWCIMFARFVDADPELKQLVDDNFEFIHVNYNPSAEQTEEQASATRGALRLLGNPVRFGYPVLVVLNSDGNVVHIQDSSLLESGNGYDRERVVRFFEKWTPAAVKGACIP